MGSAASTDGSNATPFPTDPSADESVQQKEPMSASFAADRLKQPDASDVQTLDQAATELERYAHLLPLFREGLLRAAKSEITRARRMVRERTRKGPSEADLLRESEAMAAEVGPLLEDDDDVGNPDEKAKKVEALQKEKARAVKAREYEKAGRLHTEIEAIEGRTASPENEMARIRKCRKLTERLKVQSMELAKQIEGAVRETQFSHAAELKKRKDRIMKARQPLLQYIARFTENTMKVANPVDRFKEKMGGTLGAGGGDEDEDGGEDGDDS
jgi:hypothetical protein